MPVQYGSWARVVTCAHALHRFDEELAAFAVNLPSGGGEFYLRPATVRRADTRCLPVYHPGCGAAVVCVSVTMPLASVRVWQVDE